MGLGLGLGLGTRERRVCSRTPSVRANGPGLPLRDPGPFGPGASDGAQRESQLVMR